MAQGYSENEWQHTHPEESPTGAVPLLSSITLNSTRKLPFYRGEKHSSSEQSGNFPSSTKAEVSLSPKVSDPVSNQPIFSASGMFLPVLPPHCHVLLGMTFLLVQTLATKSIRALIIGEGKPCELGRCEGESGSCGSGPS